MSVKINKKNKKKDREELLYSMFKNSGYTLHKQCRYSWYKVDFKYILSDDYDIIIECDEWNHCDKSLYDEFKRMIQIKDISDKKTIFIRFSTDVKYKYKGNIRYKFNMSIFIERVNILLKYFEKLISKKNFKHDLYIGYLFYCSICPIKLYRFSNINFNSFTKNIIAKIKKNKNKKNIVFTPRDTTLNIYKKYRISSNILDFYVSILYFV